jgi:Putative Flp pilus-assembly TadE/G-like
MTSSNPVRSLFGAIARILYDNSGASATIVAIALPGLIGFGALGAETGVWFTLKLQNQSAADAAALSAAYQIIAGKIDVISDLTPVSSEAATRNGYRGITPAVVYPYSDDIVSNGVAVTLRQTQATFLAAMFLSNVTVATRAVAVIEVFDNPCILALRTNSTGVEIADFTRLDMPNCSAVANSISRSAIELRGSTSSIAATTLVTAGEVTLQGNRIDPASPPSEFTLASLVRIGAPNVVDPYASTLTHSYLAAGMPPNLPQCGSTDSGGVKIYLGNCGIPGATLIQSSIKLTGNTRISGDWSILTSQTVDLSPGTYWITGNLTLQSRGVLKCSTCDSVKGTGVTIILPAEAGKIGAVSMAADAVFNLNAPSSGRFSGVVMVQDANGLPAGTISPSSPSSVTGAPGATLNGLVYFPNSSLTFHGNPSVTGPKCLVLVVDTLTVDQASSLETRGCAGAGLTNLPTVSTAALAE